ALTSLDRSHCQCASSRRPSRREGDSKDYLLQSMQANNAINVSIRSSKTHHAERWAEPDH
ncbi:hypothetical protein, partial [Xaviernesmea oryzae]|uniref:hypothetical protein n=1 Tax=Xaviernesmea oryzae TaxID=464029 RepID=UPI001AECDF37